MKHFTITFLFFSTFCFSQKIYQFDYLIEYEITFHQDSIKINDGTLRKVNKTKKAYYLTNSKNNEYHARITEMDSLKNKISFIDNNGVSANVTYLKSGLDEAEFIDIECKNVMRYQSQYKYEIKNYDFIKLNDTVINGKAYDRYKLESVKPKRTKRKKLGIIYYIIDKETAFHLPILDFTTAYEEWKSGSHLNNGLFFERYYIDYYGNLGTKERLINYQKIDKKIVIDDECNYARDK
ncbi:hypothetical protein ACFQ1R_11620 [Mariniflexile jejuense]|uniref:DKNYY family protein n=1 Tax=Mariniflexile jejuense TaxID=1173582 RepID=A0ABW3JJS4_9FLAO